MQIYDWKANDIGNGSYQSVQNIDIDAALTAQGQSVSATFQIRFSQRDNYRATQDDRNDGFSVDNVRIT